MRAFCLAIAILVGFGGLPGFAQRITTLGRKPDWERLERYQQTITRDEFERLLSKVYAPADAAKGCIEIRETEVVIHTTLTPPDTMTIRFAKDANHARPVDRFWKPAAKLGPAKPEKPLAGVHLALDPGHIGGAWGLMEERSFARPGDRAVQEGDMTLLVAEWIAKKTRQLGADTTLVRSKPRPASPFPLDALREPARKELALLGVAGVRENYDGPSDHDKGSTVQWNAERLFYRVAEIHERARRVNQRLQPDLVVCLHFNAEDWKNPAAPVFAATNDVHVLVHGCYSAAELRFDDQRFEMLLKLFGQTHAEETAIAVPVAASLAADTGLPPFTYTTGNAVRVNGSEWIWARNLLANRLFECPVVFLEPYRMNNEGVYARIQAGDYDGEREVAGKLQRSIFREYADAVVEGLVNYYSNRH